MVDFAVRQTQSKNIRKRKERQVLDLVQKQKNMNLTSDGDIYIYIYICVCVCACMRNSTISSVNKLHPEVEAITEYFRDANRHKLQI